MTSSPPDPPDRVDDEGPTSHDATSASGGSLAPRVPIRYQRPVATGSDSLASAPPVAPAPAAPAAPSTRPADVVDGLTSTPAAVPETGTRSAGEITDQSAAPAQPYEPAAADPAASESQADTRIDSPIEPTTGGGTPVDVTPVDVTPIELTPIEESADSPVRRRGRGLISMMTAWSVALAAITAGIVALAVLLTFGLIAHHAQAAKDSRRNAVVAAARQEVLNLLNLSGANLPTAQANLDRLLSGATGNFRSQFTAAGLAQSLVTAKAVLTGQVDAIGINSLSRNTAQVLVAAESTETTASQKTALSQLNRFIVVLQRQGGKWVVSDLGSVG